MPVQHDVLRHIGFIQQILSTNKKSVGIFIGAGCPQSVSIADKPLIPDVLGLTRLISKKLKSKDTERPSNFDKLILQFKEDGNPEPNIEQILSHVRSLYHVAGKGEVRGFYSADLASLDEEICRIISEEVDKELPHTNTPYHNLAVWVRSVERAVPVHIFTTNYDLLMEQALEESSCAYFDGFIGTKRAFFDLIGTENEQILPARWTRLWKIHGSLNWRLDKSNNVVRSDKVDAGYRYLIYPSHLKYDQSRKMPYLAMLDRLKHFLTTPSPAIFFSGYSFSDEHINDTITQGLINNPTSICYAFLYGQLHDVKYKRAVDCALAVTNLNLIAFDKGIIGRIEGEWSINDEDLLKEIPAHALSLEKVNGPEERQWYKLKLGDFAVLGAFLKVVSTTQKTEDEKEAK